MKKNNLLLTTFVTLVFSSALMAQTGFACTNGGAIYKTTNGGSNWSTTNYNGASALTGVSFVDGNIGINSLSSRNIFFVSPNPTEGILSIDVPSTTEYKIYGLNGQVVAKGKSDGQIDITNLPPGNYQLILNSLEGSTVHTIQKI